MPKSPRGLGRGLDALIPTELADDGQFDPIAKLAPGAEAVEQIATVQIKPNPHQPRQQFDASGIKELADSIRQHGIVQPLVATKTAGGYQLIAGERRLRAAIALGLKTVPVIVRSLSEQAKLEVALIENVQRQQLSPLETAMAYKKLGEQFNLKLEEIGQRVGKDLSTVSNTIRLLNLPAEAKQALADGLITEGHARQILAVEKSKQAEMLGVMLEQKLTVRQTETLAREFKKAPKDQAVAKLATSTELTDQLSKRLKTQVSISRSAKGGQLRINYRSDQDLERIVKELLGE